MNYTNNDIIALKDYIAIIQTMPQYEDIIAHHDTYTCDELYDILSSTVNLDPQHFTKTESNMWKIAIIDDHVNQFHNGLFITCVLDTLRRSLIDTTNFYEE